jgi:hypothetical protein
MHLVLMQSALSEQKIWITKTRHIATKPKQLPLFTSEFSDETKLLDELTISAEIKNTHGRNIRGIYIMTVTLRWL